MEQHRHWNGTEPRDFKPVYEPVSEDLTVEILSARVAVVGRHIVQLDPTMPGDPPLKCNCRLWAMATCSHRDALRPHLRRRPRVGDSRP